MCHGWRVADSECTRGQESLELEVGGYRSCEELRSWRTAAAGAARTRARAAAGGQSMCTGVSGPMGGWPAGLSAGLDARVMTAYHNRSELEVLCHPISPKRRHSLEDGDAVSCVCIEDTSDATEEVSPRARMKRRTRHCTGLRGGSFPYGSAVTASLGIIQSRLEPKWLRW